MWAPESTAPFIHLLIWALHISFACLHCMLPCLSFILHFFNLTFLLRIQSFPLRIHPLHFQARGYKRRPNLGFLKVVLVYFML